ncbi:N-6 DNA methylase [Paraburkholderia megapolitana]|uniref:N-6 DNA methylase n=1 Tax=Paraburkholderia megapolitana TaxID=420953 RepID=UPI0038B6C9C6
MTRRQRVEGAAMSGDPYKGAIVKLMREFSHSHNPSTVFSDFVEICALAISNRVDTLQVEPREKRYLEIVAKYKTEEVQRFAAMFAQLQLCYRERVEMLGDPGIGDVHDSGLGDVLGELFMALELSNDRAGQFFTPHSISMLMAMMTVGDGASIREQGFVTMQEPACGAGGMVVAAAQAMHHAGLNYPETLHATCVDVDPCCVHMAYVQLSLLGIPAIVVHGNTISLKVWNVWYTPAHVFVGWGLRLRRRRDARADTAATVSDDGEAQERDDLHPAQAPVASTIPASSESCMVNGDAACGCFDDVGAGDVTVALEESHIGKAVASAVSIVDLFEESTVGASSMKPDRTIFDAIEQMTLF